jgi:hypothetical protein
MKSTYKGLTGLKGGYWAKYWEKHIKSNWGGN